VKQTREGRGWQADVDGETTSIVLSGEWVAREHAWMSEPPGESSDLA
jgi:hypothetical protein